MESTKETRALAYDILAYWERYENHEQVNWVGVDVSALLDFTTEKVNGLNTNVCKTSMCAAGTAVFLTKDTSFFKHMVDNASPFTWEDEGAKALGLTKEEAKIVFYSDNKSAVRFMRAIASGKQSKFDKALHKRVTV